MSLPDIHIPPAHTGISVAGLGKRFNKEWIFKNLSREFHSGKTYAITGPNGSGKSTLLQVLWGQMPPSTGTITYRSKDGHISMENIYKHLAIATPYMDLIEEFTLMEQLRFHFSVKKVRNGLSHDEIADNMYLSHARNKYLSNFSSGMRQRVKLGLAFFSDVDILFLDEPGTNLDEQAFHWYRDQLTKIAPRTLIFIASNNPDEYPPQTEHLNIQDFK
jgi:ABC-type multidrug transport system ATPase subunit